MQETIPYAQTVTVQQSNSFADLAEDVFYSPPTPPAAGSSATKWLLVGLGIFLLGPIALIVLLILVVAISAVGQSSSARFDEIEKQLAAEQAVVEDAQGIDTQVPPSLTRVNE